MKTYAHIFDNKVVNVSLWNGESDWIPDEDVVEVPEGMSAGIGWDYIDGEFVDNRPAVGPYDSV
jgi:hypothetical protein